MNFYSLKVINSQNCKDGLFNACIVINVITSDSESGILNP